MNYYDTLGVSKNCSINDIKKAYYNLAIKYRHDEKLILLSQAYQILSDDTKRKIYDTHGSDVFGKINIVDYESLFSLFQEDSFLIIKYISCTLEQLYTGYQTVINIFRYSPCAKCNLTGSLGGDDIVDCKKCNGIGTIFNGEICLICAGTGINPLIDLCTSCKGKKIIKEIHPLEIEIPKGAHNNYFLVIENEGNYNNENRSNVIIIIRELDHEIYKRGINLFEKYCHSDMYTDLYISFTKSLTGFTEYIEYLNDDDIEVSICNVIRHGDIYVLENKGLPILNSNKHGNLYVRIYVDRPTSKELINLDSKYKRSVKHNVFTVDEYVKKYEKEKLIKKYESR